MFHVKRYVYVYMFTGIGVRYWYMRIYRLYIIPVRDYYPVRTGLLSMCTGLLFCVCGIIYTQVIALLYIFFSPSCTSLLSLFASLFPVVCPLSRIFMAGKGHILYRSCACKVFLLSIIFQQALSCTIFLKNEPHVFL